MSTATLDQSETQPATSAITPATQRLAKIVGFLYVAQMALAIFGDSFVRRSLIVPDAAQTAANITGSETQSGYIPRWLAILGIIGSLLLSAGTAAIFIFPAVGAIGVAHMLPLGVYEIGLGFYLMFKGLRAPQT
jgi:hypothetical protein